MNFYLLFILAAALFQYALGECSCAQVGCGYTGSESQCFCWAQNTCNMEHCQTGTVTYFPSGEFSSGGCTMCPSGTSNEKVIFYVGVFYCNGGTHQDPVSGIIECNLYIGEQPGCFNWCNQTAYDYKFAGEFTCTYIPNGEFSQGSCMVRGNQNPCTVPFEITEKKEILSD